ncbi:hypothetical protein ASD11_13515 [Aeromicrobium sp. Root495]|uniref:penicillin acylase family protein n=1 Tax=Aeromicrobium sp. Root495 TaxID=1736550 RepID=UPI0006F7A4A8|nr:penicillin acylase family protein [Aeromicrobium sp. Root495]KQY60458.1 hypothetical protein ASD11_13515 [Aeromicrobium sp. Root495]
MTVLRVEGGSAVELARRQGELTARARGAQLEDDHAHVLARTGTAWDDVARRLLVEETARQAMDALDDESRTFFAAYAEGVEVGLADSERRVDRPWEPWTPLGVFHVHHVLFGALGHHLWRRHVARTLGPAAVLALAHEVPAVSGSNAWAVGGARSADGAPIIAADPHRLLHFPGVYQQVHLVAPGLDVVGLTIPGVPGVQHFGHTGSVAWAVTNAMADTQDLVDVLLRSDSVDAAVEVDLGDGWETATVLDGVVRTRLGPVLVGSPAEGSGIVVRTAVHVSRDLGLGAVLPLLRSRTAADVGRALDGWVDPVNDVVVADTAGTVLRRVAGRVPRRVAGDWLGWVDHAVEEVPPDGWVVSANHRRGPESDALATEFAPPHRARRLEQLVGERDGWTVEAAGETLLDTVLLTAASWQGRLKDVEVLGPADDLRLRLLAWDGRMDADSRGAAAFAAVRGALVRRLAAAPALSGLWAESGLPAMFRPWLTPEPRIALALDRWLEEGAPFGLDLTALLAESLEEVAATGHAPTWGETHAVVGPDGTPVPVGGDEGCVLSTSSRPGLDDTCWRGPAARVVWSLADRDASRWVVPDDLDAWATGVLHPVKESR